MNFICRTMRTAVIFCVVAGSAIAAQFGASQYPIKADDGEPISNFGLNAELSARLAKLPGQVDVGNLQGDVTLVQFYDLNCPFCREAAADVDALVRADKKLKLVFVPYAVLSVPSVQGAMIEIGASKMLTPQKFLDFHRRIYASRGVIDGARVLAAAQNEGLDPQALAKASNTEATLAVLKENATVGGQAGLAATPAYVIGGVAILGHPGLRSLQTVVAAMRACGKVVC
jgi:protein-disulfide isomerase